MTTSTRPATARPPAAPWYFLAWLAVGAGFCLSLATVLTIGVFVLPATIVALIVLLSRPGSRNSSAAGAISGLGLVPLYVAFLNRSGPGTVCSSTAGGGQECTDQWSPWPFLAIGLLLVAAGLGLFLALRRRVSEPQA
jgi:MYXO-CTERM domain-containing protein